MPEKLRVHLVLGAGGMKTIGYIGTLHELADRGVEFASIAACSAGSVFGACLAAGVAPELLRQTVMQAEFEELIGEPAMRWAPGGWAQLSWPRARFKESGLPELFRRLAGGDPTFAELEVPFATVGLDLISSRMLVYSRETTPNMRVADAVGIATAVPFLFPPHETSERVIVDGALASQLPVWLAMAEPEQCPIVAVTPRRSLVHPRDLGLPDYLASLVALGGVSRDLYLLEQMPATVLIEIDAADAEYDEFDLSPEKRGLLIGAGRAAAAQAYPRIVAAHTGHARPISAHGTGDREPSSDALAEAGGIRLMRRVSHALVRQSRTQVFISYAREEREWANRVREMLMPIVRSGRAAVWDDSDIASGSDWRNEIDRALAHTKVAVLLVSRAYLASDFIHRVELVQILRAAEGEGLTVIWVLLSACLWEDTALEPFQCANDPANPLAGLAEAEQEEVLSNIARQVKASLGTERAEQAVVRVG